MNLRKRAWAVVMFMTVVALSVMADALSDYINSPSINGPSTGVLIIDLKTGKELANHNATKPFMPASIMKSVTIATLLEKVGANYRYSTPVYMTGDVRGGVLDGNIIVSSSADPSINTRYSPGSKDIVKELTDALKSLGVTRITGKVIVDESQWPGPATNPRWAEGDLKHAYGTGTHGFNFEDNAKDKFSVADPSATFRSKLKSSLTKAGIKLEERQLADSGKRYLLGEHRSETIDEIMRSCMMRSDNQYAESMLRLVGKKYGNVGSSAKGAEEMTKFWRNRHATMTGVTIVDGSGLSRSNRVTARFMADVLKRMAKNPYYASFFPLAGQEGTLSNFLKGTPLDSYIAMKTGSMNGIQCYAGYKLDHNYVPTHIVVIIMNDMGDREKARKETERFLLTTFKNSARK